MEQDNFELEEKKELTPFPVPIVVTARNKDGVISLAPISIPITWIDAMSFNGQGFTVIVNFPDSVMLEKGSTIRFEVGQVRRVEGEEDPPFDPPYASNAKPSKW